MAILIFQHSDILDPGCLANSLRDHGYKLDIRRSDLGDPVPEGYDDIDALIVLGGAQNVTEGHAWLERECGYIRGAHEQDLPVVGICLGAQMIAHTFGGGVGPMVTPEIGMTSVELTGAGQNDTILAGLPWNFYIYEKHMQEVRSLPEGAVLLASSGGCKHQAFRFGMRTYAFQFHFEYDRSTMLDSVRGMDTEMGSVGLSNESLARDIDTYYEQTSRLADRISLNIASFLIPRRSSVVGE